MSKSYLESLCWPINSKGVSKGVRPCGLTLGGNCRGVCGARFRKSLVHSFLLRLIALGGDAILSHVRALPEHDQ